VDPILWTAKQAKALARLIRNLQALFPSEKLDRPCRRTTPISLHPATVGEDQTRLQVMRRTNASLMRELGVDPNVVADLMGYDVDVNLNVFTQNAD
jgi:hypothetical protein